MRDERRKTDGERPFEGIPSQPAAAPTCVPDAHGHCATCSDEALPATVLSVDDTAGLALVALGDATVEVDVSLVDDVQPDAVLLVHGGVAIAKL